MAALGSHEMTTLSRIVLALPLLAASLAACEGCRSSATPRASAASDSPPPFASTWSAISRAPSSRADAPRTNLAASTTSAPG
jgi:hypothetical protein